jgi:hypothetical protein
VKRAYNVPKLFYRPLNNFEIRGRKTRKAKRKGENISKKVIHILGYNAVIYRKLIGVSEEHAASIFMVDYRNPSKSPLLESQTLDGNTFLGCVA